MPSTYIETILNCFATLDIEKLRFYLKEEYSYEDTTKEVFLNEIEKIFDAHKNSGDKELLIYSGKCTSETCDNCGKGGYRFVGNHTKNCLSLIFIKEGDDIKDIFCCSEFQTDTDPGELGGCADIYINTDDRIDFNKTPEYWSKVNSALAAYDEIITTPPTKLDFDTMMYWLDKHSFTNARIGNYDLFGSPLMKWTNFSRLYSELKELKNFILSYEDVVRDAQKRFGQITDEQGLIDWLLSHETLFKKVPFEFKYGAITEGGYKLDTKTPILFTGDCFNTVFQFINSYTKHDTELLVKYSTYNGEDVSEIFCDENYRNDTDHVFSLRFHLEKRKEAEELGIKMPLFLRKEENDWDKQLPE